MPAARYAMHFRSPPLPTIGSIVSSVASAADLKFLHRLRQTHFRNFKSKSGTRIIYLLVPLLLPKFVSEGAAMYHELRKRGTRACSGQIDSAFADPHSSPPGLT